MGIDKSSYMEIWYIILGHFRRNDLKVSRRGVAKCPFFFYHLLKFLIIFFTTG